MWHTVHKERHFAIASLYGLIMIKKAFQAPCTGQTWKREPWPAVSNVLPTM